MIYVLAYFTVSVLWLTLLKFLKIFKNDDEYLTVTVLCNFFLWPISVTIVSVVLLFVFIDRFVKYIFKS